MYVYDHFPLLHEHASSSNAVPEDPAQALDQVPVNVTVHNPGRRVVHNVQGGHGRVFGDGHDVSGEQDGVGIAGRVGEAVRVEAVDAGHQHPVAW